MASERDKSGESELERTVAMSPESAADAAGAALDPELAADIARLKKVKLSTDGTVKMSVESQKNVAEQRAVPFKSGGDAPPKLTDAERTSMQAENFSGTVSVGADAIPEAIRDAAAMAHHAALAYSPASIPPVPPKPASLSPTPVATPASQPISPMNAPVIAQPVETSGAPLDHEQPIENDATARGRARALGMLALADDGALARFGHSKLRVGDRLSEADLRRLRDIMRALYHATSSEDDAGEQIDVLWKLVCPAPRSAE
jgi:hypothetical protein